MNTYIWVFDGLLNGTYRLVVAAQGHSQYTALERLRKLDGESALDPDILKRCQLESPTLVLANALTGYIYQTL